MFGMKNQKAEGEFVLCINNERSEDLEKRKVYEALPDDEAAKEGYLRIVDESVGGLPIRRNLLCAAPSSP